MKAILYGHPDEVKTQFAKGTFSKKVSESEMKDFEQLMKLRQKYIQYQCQQFPQDFFENHYELEVYVPLHRKILHSSEYKIILLAQ